MPRVAEIEAPAGTPFTFTVTSDPTFSVIELVGVHVLPTLTHADNAGEADGCGLGLPPPLPGEPDGAGVGEPPPEGLDAIGVGDVPPTPGGVDERGFPPGFVVPLPRPGGCGVSVELPPPHALSAKALTIKNVVQSRVSIRKTSVCHRSGIGRLVMGI